MKVIACDFIVIVRMNLNDGHSHIKILKVLLNPLVIPLVDVAGCQSPGSLEICSSE